MSSFQACWHFREPKQPGNGGGNLDRWIAAARKCLQWPAEGWAKGRHGSGERETSKPLSAPLSKKADRLCARSPPCESFPCQESSQTAWWLFPQQISRRWGLCKDCFAAASIQPMLYLHLINCWWQCCHINSILLLINEVAVFESFCRWLPRWLAGVEAKLCRLGWQRLEGRRQGKGIWGTWCFYFPFWCFICFYFCNKYISV